MPGVLEYVSAGRPELQDEAARRMQRFTIREVEIKRNLKIDIVAHRGMEVADVSFNAIISLEGGGFELRRQPLFFVPEDA